MLRLMALVLYAAGGACAGLLFYMRVCNRLPSGSWKRMFGRGLLFALTALGVAGGAWAGWTGWVAVPALILVLFIAAEIYYVRKGARLRAEGPVEIRDVLPGRGWLTTRALRTLRYEIEGPWPEADRVRMAHISDLHVNDSSDSGYLRSAAAAVAEARPDLIVITGDFVNRVPWSRKLDDFLSRLQAPLGVVATLGNHDYAAGSERIRAELEKLGVQVLHGAPLRIERPPVRLGLIGDDRPWGPAPPPVAEWPEDIPRIGLSHSPDSAYAFARAGVALAFCGHLHAGQIRFPGWGPAAVPSRESRCFEHGHYRIGDLHLFVSAGVGCVFPPFRFRCRPDIILVDYIAPRPPAR